MDSNAKTVAIIVAHPDDETLWAGGTILSHPEWKCFIYSLCRRDDIDRAPKFQQTLTRLGADGQMGDLDDGPQQAPLPEEVVENAILALLPDIDFDIIITHSIYGEYTRHRRHEEIGAAVINLWFSGKLQTKQLLSFAYDDAKRTVYPQAIKNAPVFQTLPDEIWKRKYQIITQIYGFSTASWEAEATPKEEAFWQFFTAAHARQWLVNRIKTE